MVGRQHRDGFSLAEVIIALLLLGIAVLSYGAASATAARLLRGAELATGAALLAAATLDSLGRNPLAGADSVRSGPFRGAWIGTDTAGGVLLEIDVQYHDGDRLRSRTFATFAAPAPPRIDRLP
jgi:prepilin-type N-terminal cleavage/methylation domain-containing protein